jgi:hypothetical protein
LLLIEDKEEAIVSGNYERTREQTKTSTVYNHSNTQKTKVLVKYQWNARGGSTNNVTTVEKVPEKDTKSR